MKNIYLAFLIAGSLSFICALCYGFMDLEQSGQIMLSFSIFYFVVALHFKD